MPLIVYLALWWAPIAFGPGEFIEGPLVDSASGRHAWLARRGSEVWVCWHGPGVLGAAPSCFLPLELPAAVDPAGDWRVRFAGEDRLELLDHQGRVWVRGRDQGDWAPAPDDPLDPDLARSTLFFAGEPAPCGRRGLPVPHFADQTPTWTLRPCPRRCLERGTPSPHPSKLAGLRARAHLSATRARRIHRRGDWGIDPTSESLSWDGAVWVGLELAFDAERRRVAQRPSPRRPRRSCGGRQ